MGVTRARSSSNGKNSSRTEGDPAGGSSFGPFGVCNYDGPETIRARKYATGTHVLLQEIGIETGLTPGEVVWSRNKARLYRYRRPGEGSGVGERRPVPVLLVYGFVLKPYVLDLVPGNSLVEYLVGEGFDVYMLDFGISGSEDAKLSLEDFVLDYMHGAVEKVVETSGAEGISLFGQSQGGTLCAMYAALFPEGPVKNLVLLSAPTEFVPRGPGLLGLWTLASRSGKLFFDPAVVPVFSGNLPTDLAGSFINTAASLQAAAVGWTARAGGSGFYDAVLREIRAQAGRDVSLRSWLAVSRWVDDAAPFPGETFRRWVRDFYQRDKLVKGQIELRGLRVDLSNIGCSVLNVSGKWDYVVPPSQTEATTVLASSKDKESVALDAGHVGMLVGPGAAELWPRVRDWLAPRSGR
ncbi:MAG: Polyhydroxyalkanoic acid synthase [uncultured Rubrobacteraceae bacterium]|uniref:Polyhydroxyalkanoic acid synthase n=1 Tax=uncultured Rubrobacteraceae bacterium TaxID=349277 RepID=A0A6J4NJQ6_9ACTN|nr:MAG: Polyhydroxyalkanoic acid synthase [uncultured Rubrobacteraceae bacterium]